jgi:SAM-dependent methyltransferase
VLQTRTVTSAPSTPGGPPPAGTDPESIARNRAAWNAAAPDWVERGRRSWATDEITWGELSIPESAVGALPDVAGRDVVELGCGTAYVSAWLGRRGARPVGVDPSEGQLASARAFQHEFGPVFPLVQAAGEAVPLGDGCCDLVVSEYGAAIWADPYRWLPEAARLLRPGGEVVFLGNSLLFVLCAPDAEEPAGDRLVRPQRGLHRVVYTDDPGVEFHLPHGEMIRLLRRCGFDVVDLIELHPPDGPPPADAGDGPTYFTRDWARSWPAEEIWRARKRG